MSLSVNKVILVGNVGHSPELRYTPSGTPTATFSMATSERWKGADGEMQEHTEWHNIVAWRRLAEVVKDFVAKGSRVYVEGKIRTRKWTGRDGEERQSREVIADNLILLDGKQEARKGRPADDVEDINPEGLTDDDIPF